MIKASLQTQLHALHGRDNRKAFRQPWKDSFLPLCPTRRPINPRPHAWIPKSRQRGVHALRRDEINSGMMYYARWVCEYREGKYAPTHEISRIMRAQCASGTAYRVIWLILEFYGKLSEVVGRLINYQTEVKGERNRSLTLDDELWLFSNSKL